MADVASNSTPSPTPTGPPKLPVHYKMFIAPVVMFGLGKAGVDYKDPMTILAVQVLYIISQGIVFLILGYIGWEILKLGDNSEPLKLKKPKKGGGFTVEETTLKKYDMKELQTHLTTFGVGLLVTVAVHVYYGVLPALILQIVMQPIALWEHGLFASYVLGYHVPRPFPSAKTPPSPWGAPAPAPAAPPQEEAEGSSAAEQMQEDSRLLEKGEPGAGNEREVNPEEVAQDSLRQGEESKEAKEEGLRRRTAVEKGAETDG